MLNIQKTILDTIPNLSYILGMTILRSVNISQNSSFFLFGARGVGKSTYIREQFPVTFELSLNLLIPAEFQRYIASPGILSEQIQVIKQTKSADLSKTWIYIDEVQRVPALLDLVHHHIETDKIKFALSGSSARKLRRGAANLLAGRAFTYNLYPLTARELGQQFSLDTALRFGTLPKLLELPDPRDKHLFLQSYTQTYLQEEIWNEHVVRALPPFQKFLAIAAQMNGEIINFSRIGDEAGIDPKSAQGYFQILEDTLLGFFLEPYHRSVRKRQRESPKFYFFDLGVTRALQDSLGAKLVPGSSTYGKAFEHFVIAELIRENNYRRCDCRFSYLRTKDNAEIDLIIERNSMPPVLVEIKSTTEVGARDLATLRAFKPDFPKCRAVCLSNDSKSRIVEGGIEILPWQAGLEEILA